MSSENEGQEKTEEATPQRIEKAREEGDIPRSTDAQAAAAYAGFALAMLIAVYAGAEGLGSALIPFLSDPMRLADAVSGPGGQATTMDVAARVLFAVLPVLALPAAAVLVALVVQRGIVFAPKKIMPKLSNISVISNAKQKYGPAGLVEFLKSAVKMFAVALVLYFALLSEFDNLPRYLSLNARILPHLLEAQVWNVLGGVLAITVLIALIDILWQRVHHRNRLRMSHQELRDEVKQSEGDPQLRQTRRDRAREIATNRMLLDVPKADVVVVNPTHFAVALKWERASPRPPVCLAKGVDEVAARIRAAAEEAGVPIHSDPPTARSIHAMVEVGHEIMPEHFRAAAAAIVFADRMRQKRTGSA